MHEFLSGNESYYEPMPMDMLEDICDRSQPHLSINRREARYKILDCIKQSQVEWKSSVIINAKHGKISKQRI